MPAVLRLVAIVVLACLPAFAGAATTALHLQSQAGDYIGQGQKQTLLASDLTFQVTAGATGINVNIHDSSYDTFWYLTFTPAAGHNFANGVYEGAQRASFKAPGVPGMDVEGDGRGCNTDAGRFSISDLQKDANGVFTRFVLQFEQHCEGAAPALFGQLQYNAGGLAALISVAGGNALKGNAGTSDGVATLSLSHPLKSAVSVNWATQDGTATAGVNYLAAQGTVTFAPQQTTAYAIIPIIGDTKATHGRTFKVALSAPTGAKIGASSGTVKIIDPNAAQTVLALNSQAGDYVGGGLQWLETSAYTSFTTANSSASVAEISLGNPENWSLDFAAPSGETLTPGTYLNAQRWPFQSQSAPGLSVDGDGAGCNTVTGQFTVLSITPADSGGLDGFAADFEQHCEGGTAALFGSIRVNAVLTQISITNAVISGDTAVFTATVHPAVSGAVKAFFATSDGSAKAGADYKASSGVITIPAGASEGTIKVKLLDTPAPGSAFFCSLTATSLPPVWISTGAARF